MVETAYFCPGDDKEAERLDMQHALLTELLGDSLHLCPFRSGNTPVNILDVCCGTGIWTIDVADEYPNCIVKGADLAPIQPSWVPPNASFEMDDMRLPWTFRPESFNLIHTRSTIHTGCWGDFKTEAIQEAFGALQPGGWLECQEFGSLVKCDDGSLPVDSALATWARDASLAASQAGRPRDVADRMRQWFKEVGFVDVHEVRYKLPIGGWTKDARLAYLGKFWWLLMNEGLDALSTRLFSEVLCWDEAQTKVRHLGLTFG
ncbi:S-adenosyl-L-methionine-dependent methyltransferase [Immersiella caudata]|uniref:S-adenosyl-L-methionine-dependent methyltransferase n=1 Tax=Immersiella caudata TaxID=314043 RepID=A0AA40C0J7_9PEZI|nr:S-adenosyl-L-methionine-dependent methyltransferase [Immersiella caudata]